MSGSQEQQRSRGLTGWQRGTILWGPARTPGTESAVIVKLGGSLLSRPGWPALVAALVADRGPGPRRLVVGGGAVVDGLRSLDRVAPQPASLMHALAIDGMRMTGRLVAEALSLPMATTVADAAAVAVLDVPAWLAVGRRADSLPPGWHVTSDTIAARIAVEHGSRLLLVKSVPPPPCPAGTSDRLAVLAAADWVDPHFQITAEPLGRIEWAAPAA